MQFKNSTTCIVFNCIKFFVQIANIKPLQKWEHGIHLIILFVYYIILLPGLGNITDTCIIDYVSKIPLYLVSWY